MAETGPSESRGMGWLSQLGSDGKPLKAPPPPADAVAHVTAQQTPPPLDLRALNEPLHAAHKAAPPPEVQLPSSASYTQHDFDAAAAAAAHTPVSAAAGEESMAKSIVMSEQLEALTHRVPLAGQTVEAIIRLMDLCVAARPVAQNARELARLCLDVVDLIEDLVDVDNVLSETFFKELHRAFVTAGVHVELFVRDGWLIHVALMDDVKGHFEDLHVLIIDILQGSVPEHFLTDVMQHKRRYTNPSRLLCRVLRQLGNGNVVDGMYAAKDDSVHDKAIVHALTPSTVTGVDVVMVRRELKGLPPKSRKIDLACMYRTGATGSLSEVRDELGPQAVAQLRHLYTAFSTYGQRYNGAAGMDGARFTKLTNDSGLTGRGRRLKGTDVDLVFAKVRSKGARVITFEQFVDALAALAARANLPLVDVTRQVLSSDGPVTRATETVAVRFYDDKSTYTGTWAHGGGPPTNHDGPKDLATQLSRAYKPELRRTPGPGTPQPRTPPPNAPMATPRGRLSAPGSFMASAEAQLVPSRSPGMAAMDPLQMKFIQFAIFGKGPVTAAEAEARPKAVLMDSKGFAKLCKESKVMSGKLDLTRVDLCFTKCCDKLTKRLKYSQFLAALAAAADARGVEPSALQDRVASCDGPIVHGTQADSVRFHDHRASLGTPPTAPPKGGRKPLWQER